MLSFLWRLRGSISVPPGLTPASLLDRVEAALADHGKDVLPSDGLSLAFTGHFWEDALGLNGHALFLYDRGRLWLDGGGGTLTLRWELSSLRLFLACFLTTASAGLFVGWSDGWRSGVAVALGGFAWIYGSNLLIALVRVPRFLRKRLA